MIEQTAIQNNGNDSADSPDATSPLTVPCTTKGRIAEAQIVFPPSSNKRASGNDRTTDKSMEANAIAKGSE